jgi:uroporphyrinogen-III synthase
VRRADVYAREPVALAPRALQQLREARAPLVLALSSGEALQRVLDAAPADTAAVLRRARVIAASARLAALARDCGFTDVVQADGPRPRDLIAAAVLSFRPGRLPVA